jgi:hypothetical protein
VTTWILIVGCGTVLALPLVWRIGQHRFDPFEPIVLFALAYGVMFVVRPASMLVNDERTFWGVEVLPTLPRALVLALVGAVAFVTGYELRTGRVAANRLPTPRPIDTRIALGAALAASAIALIALVVFLPASEGAASLKLLLGGRSHELGLLLHDKSTYVSNGSLLFAPAAFILVALALRRPSPYLIAGAAIVSGLALLRVAPVGGRMVLLPLVGGLLVLAYVMRERRPRMVALAGIGLVALVMSYFILQLRDPANGITLRTAVGQFRDHPQAVFDPVLRGDDAEMVVALSAALSVIPSELSYRWGGATVGNLFVRPVPRELWSGKPLPPEDDVVVTLWPQNYPDLDPAFSPLLPLYWDFGLAGVALGMGLFGIAARLFYEWFLLHRRAFGAQIIYSAGLWFVVIAVRNDPVDTIVLAAFTFLPIVAIVAIASQGVIPALSSRRSAGEAGRTSAGRQTQTR